MNKEELIALILSIRKEGGTPFVFSMGNDVWEEGFKVACDQLLNEIEKQWKID